MMTGFYCPLNTPLYVYYREIKILQTLHKTLHFIYISLIIRALHCVGFKPKILHKPCIEPYMGTKRQREEEWERGRESKTRGRLSKTRGRLSKTRGRERKTRGRLSKTRGRERKTRGREIKI